MTDNIAVLGGRDVIRVSGSAAAEYLQGQLSQDVAALEPGDSAWSLALQPNGRVDTWLRMHRVTENEFVLDLDPGYGATAVTRLERFRLRTDVRFVLEPGWSMLGIRGPDASSVSVESELRAPVTWPGFEGVDHLGSDLVVPDGSVRVDATELEARRVAAGWPRLGTELTAATIPAEAGPYLIELSVSFTKGCYTGQELVARIDSRGGNVPRPLRVLVAGPDAGWESGATVVADGVDVGTITSTAVDVSGDRSLALATVLRRIEAGVGVTVDATPATVCDAPV